MKSYRENDALYANIWLCLSNWPQDASRSAHAETDSLGISVSFAIVLSLVLTQQWCARYVGDTDPARILVTALCHAFNRRSILGQSYFQHCMMKSLLLFSAVGGELVSDPEAEVKVITSLQNHVLLPSKNDIFSILLFWWKEDISQSFPFHSFDNNEYLK